MIQRVRKAESKNEGSLEENKGDLNRANQKCNISPFSYLQTVKCPNCQIVMTTEAAI